MLGLSLILLLTLLGLVAILWTGSLLGQAYIYDQPADGLEWRGPAAGAAVGAFLALWCLLATRAPGDYDTLFRFSSYDISKPAARLWSLRRDEIGQETEIPYEKRTDARGRVTYVNPDGQPWQRSSSGMMVAILIPEEGKEGKTRFNAELTPQGQFQTTPNQPLRYLEEGGGRIVTETNPGVIERRRPGLLLTNLLLNGVHFLVWFAVLWPLLRFQWSHAFGLALAAWVATTLLVLPMLFDRAIRVGEQRAAARRAQAAVIYEGPALTSLGRAG